jgi:type II secretory pathway pseudopilin PulG
MSLILTARPRGFTLLETVMAMGAVGAVGLAIFYTLFSGLLLFTKNSALNVSHEEARVAIIQLDQDLHSAVSLPELTDSNANLIGGQGPAAGVEFQELVQPSQYCQVTANVAAGARVVPVGIPSGYPTPTSAMRLIIPAYQLETNISAVTVSGTVASCTIATPATNAITTSDSNGTYNVTCFFTQRVYYYVTADPALPPLVIDSQGDTAPALELNYIGINKTKSYVMASSGISDQTPFSIPNDINGAPNYHNVVAINLSAVDQATSSLITRFKFNISSIMLSGTIPAYSTLTTYQ